MKRYKNIVIVEYNKIKMKILFISGREPTYARNRILLKALKRSNNQVILVADNSKLTIIRYIKVLIKYLILKKRKHDLLYIGFFGQPLVPIIKRLTKKKIIFDAFMSAYDTLVFDKKKIKPNSLLAKFLYYLDKRSCQLSDIVLLDTNQHINYFVEKFNLPRNKFRRIFIGADDELFKPMSITKDKSKFIVEFHGGFIPLQGVEYIIQVAKLLEKNPNIIFKLIGKGQTYKKCRDLTSKLKLKNVVFEGEKKFNEIPTYVAEADVGLGIFGDTDKTQRVIPNKAYEILAMKKPLITSDTPASRELLKDKENVLFCKVKDPESLAKAILILKKNKRLRDKITLNGYKIFKEKCTPLALGKELRLITKELI